MKDKNSFLKKHRFVYSALKASFFGLGAYTTSFFLNGKKSPSNRFFKNILNSRYFYLGISFSFSYDLGKFFIKGYNAQNSQKFFPFLLDLCKSVIWKNNIYENKELSVGEPEFKQPLNSGSPTEFSPPVVKAIKSEEKEKPLLNSSTIVAHNAFQMKPRPRISDFIEQGIISSAKDKLEIIHIYVFSATRKPKYLLTEKYMENYNFPGKMINITYVSLKEYCLLEKYKEICLTTRQGFIFYLFVDVNPKEKQTFIDLMMTGVPMKELIKFVQSKDNNRGMRDNKSSMYFIPFVYCNESLEGHDTEIVALTKHSLKFDSASLERYRVHDIESFNFSLEAKEDSRGYMNQEFEKNELYYLYDSQTKKMTPLRID